MANHKSAIKRAKQNQRRMMINKSRKTVIKSFTRKVETAVNANTPEEAQVLLREAQKKIARTAAKGTIHKNTAARKISRLSRLVNTIS